MLEGLKPVLERQGSLQRREGPYGESWRLRYLEPGPDGSRVQRSFELGGRAEVEAVGTWLHHCQQGYRVKVEAERLSREEASAQQRKAEETRATLRAYCVGVGNSRRQRRDLGKEFDAVADDPRKVIMLCTKARVYGPLPPRRAGRPLKRRLW